MNFNPFDLLKNPAALKEKLEQVQENLKNITATGSSGGGLVKVTMTAKKVVQSININPDAVDTDDLTMLEDLIVAALNDGYAKADKECGEKMGAFGGLGL